MAITDFYPEDGAGGGNVTCDGDTSRGSNAVWSTIRNSAGQSADAVGVDFWSGVGTHSSAGIWNYIYRAHMGFDTSVLTSGATVSAAELSVYVNSKADDFTDSIALVASTPASDNELVAADYQEIGTTLYAPVLAISGISTGTYNAFTLNAAGLAAINKTGITHEGLRNESDRTDIEPTWFSYDDSRIICASADYTGTTRDPRLRVTHTTGGATEKSSADTGAGVDASILEANLTAADSGSGADASTLVVEVSIADGGVGVDALALSAETPIADAGSGVDAFALVAELDVADSGSGVDVLSLDMITPKSIADVGTGTDASSLVVEITVADVGFGVDALSLLAELVTADNGVGLDEVHVGTPIPPGAKLIVRPVQPPMHLARPVQPTEHIARPVRPPQHDFREG